jgi:tRNA G10  N-methylase Trm11
MLHRFLVGWVLSFSVGEPYGDRAYALLSPPFIGGHADFPHSTSVPKSALRQDRFVLLRDFQDTKAKTSTTRTPSEMLQPQRLRPRLTSSLETLHGVEKEELRYNKVRTRMELEPSGKILVHWRYVQSSLANGAGTPELNRRNSFHSNALPLPSCCTRGEGVEGYSMQFRHLEFLGALAALLRAQDERAPSLEELLHSGRTRFSASNYTIAADRGLISFKNSLNYTGSLADKLPQGKRTRYNQAMQYVDFHDDKLKKSISRELLARVADRCSLIHALYEVVAEAGSFSAKDEERNSTQGAHRRHGRYEALAESALANDAFSDMNAGGENELASWCLRVRHYGDSVENKDDGDVDAENVRRHSVPRARHAGKKTRSMEKEREALLALRPLLIPFGGPVNLRHPDTKIYILDGLINSLGNFSAVLARRLATGGHSQALSIAPSTRICVTNTPLCPIASFVIVNVAGVQGSETILDPYVGSGGILLAAALIDNRVRTVGIDVAHGGLIDRDHLRRDFADRNLTQPLELIQGDSTDANVRRLARSAVGGKPFDLILTDPPYGIRESTVRQTNPICDLLESIATDREAGHRLLRKGGKLVCFVPCQADHTISNVLPTAEQMNEAGLRIEAIREQPLNSKLSRWLVSFVCYR